MASEVVHGVPDYGPMVKRENLLAMAAVLAPALTVVCAPSGCGKSVLAAQIAALSESACIRWIGAQDCDGRGDEWLSELLAVAAPAGAAEGHGIGAMLSPSPGYAETNALLRIRDWLSTADEQQLIIVLDGVGRVGNLNLLIDVAALIRRCTVPSSRLIVTCRRIDWEGAGPDPSLMWLIGEADLRLTESEVVTMLKRAGRGQDAEGEARHLISRFAGHPGLTALMLRHSRIDDSVDVPQDLVWYTQRLVAQIPDTAMPLLYAAALLGEGTLADLAEGSRLVDLARSVWPELRMAAPLVTVVVSEDTPTSFRMHAVMRQALVMAADNRLSDESATEIRANVLAYAAQRSDWAMLLGVLARACMPSEIVDCFRTQGPLMLHALGPRALERCLERVPAVIVAADARILLLKASILRERERVAEALSYTTLARRMAEVDGDAEAEATAVLLEVRLALDEPDFEKAAGALARMRGSLLAGLDIEMACVYECYAAFLAANAWAWSSAEAHAAKASGLLVRLRPGSHEAALASNTLAGVTGLFLGRWDRVVQLLAGLEGAARSAATQSLVCRANCAIAHMEMGAMAEAERLLERAFTDAEDAGAELLRAYVLSTWSDTAYDTDREISESRFRESQACFASRSDRLGSAGGHVQRALLTRSVGLLEESLTHAEAALACLTGGGDSLRTLSVAARIEVAASLLALGDACGSRHCLEEIDKTVAGSAACAHALCADMVLAEIERRDGRTAAAANRMRTHGDYIATGSGNWRIAMYIRAFPGLLGVLCSAIGPGALPPRMLRLIPQATFGIALQHATAFTRPEDRVLIGSRVSGSHTEQHAHARVEPSATACSVRLFGRLEVRSGLDIVADDCWRKRKARLLFAMLVVRQGQDVPRDVVLERLWPDMDAERARRNFYVTWSAMKRALAGNGAPADAKHLVSCAGGVCRVTRAVRSDLDDFDEIVARLRSADAAQDAAGVVAAASQLAVVYQDELLPGDVYEEWFADIRERTKHDFCDAMICAARAAESVEAYGDALVLLRRAAAADPWREDTYQCMMRCQMAAGQRSRAIETYLSCRARLVDDLGIDPSIETTRLYQAVLALEDDSAVREGLSAVV